MHRYLEIARSACTEADAACRYHESNCECGLLIIAQVIQCAVAEAYTAAGHEVDGEIRQVCESEHLPTGVLGRVIKPDICGLYDCFDIADIRKIFHDKAASLRA